MAVAGFKLTDARLHTVHQRLGVLGQGVFEVAAAINVHLHWVLRPHGGWISAVLSSLSG